jgi:diadenylate cyclase
VGNERDEKRRATLAVVAPGTELRDGLERIVRGNTGALIVLGFDDVVRAICSGGFELGAEFSATRLRELAKMDGAIVLDRAGSSILRAGVQLVPDPALPTQESGTRHRTAERVARQTGFPVITVSKSMRVIAVYADSERYVLDDSAALLTRAHQALATLERYKRRQDQATGLLSALEIEDRTTVRDIAAVAQRLEMASRIADEIAGYLIELGTDGGLLALQLDELTAGSSQERELFLRDYAPAAPSGPQAGQGAGPQAGAGPGSGPQAAAGAGPDPQAGAGRRSDPLAAGPGTGPQAGLSADRLARLSADELLDMQAVAAAVGQGLADDLDQQVSPRGYRLLGRISRLPASAIDRLVEHFGGLQKLLSASVQDLRDVPGVDAVQAARVRDGLSRLAESALLDGYP